MSKKVGVILVVFLLVGFSLSLSSCRCVKTQPPNTEKSWELPILVNNGQTVENEIIRMPDYIEQSGAKALILHFTATWDQPTIMIPLLQELYNHYQNQGLAILLISIDNSENLQEQIIKDITENIRLEGETGKITLPVCWDLTQKVKELYGITAVPTTYLINQENKIVFDASSFYEGIMEELEKEILLLLNN